MKRFDSINVIPLIDVMLVLLAIVLMTASFIVKDSLTLTLPETESSHTYQPTNEKTFHIQVTASNQYFIEKNQIALQTIEQRIATLPSDHPVVIEVDKLADFGSFVALIDLLKGHNQHNLTILTKAKTSP